MTTSLRCPSCYSDHITDGSSRLVALLGVVALISGLAALYALCPAQQVADWSHFTTFQDHDPRALLVIGLGIFLIWGGLHHPETLFCTKCGYTWERYSPPKVQLRPSNRRPH